ncbi:MAG TPA: hypothetical protein VMD91_17780 [Candidatus Sulfotelmatobacter sp.]|nr:hypothetical protein [Candidatus Sulfotelmatobacter sp.]
MTASPRLFFLALGLGCAPLLAACSGGAAAPSATPKAPTATPTPTTQNIAKATGTLHIKFSHIKEHLSASARKGAGGPRRTPKFVDPAVGSYLEIASWGSCQQYTMGIFNFNTVTIVPVAPNQPDGSQVASVPIVADGCSTNVYVYEVNEGDQSPPTTFPTYTNVEADSGGDLLAYGEGTIPSATSAGTTVGVTVTMSIAPYQLGMAFAPTLGDAAGTPDGTDSDSPSTFSLDNYTYAPTSDGWAYGYAVAGDLAQSIDSCYFGTDPVGAGGMPTIALVQQTSSGTSRIGQVASGAWVLYYDGSNAVEAEFSTTVGPFPTDGPYAPGYTGLPYYTQATPIISTAQQTTGWVNFVCNSYCTDDP